MKKEIMDFCKKNNITSDQFFGKEKIGGDLGLRSLTSIPEGFNPTVGGDLDLRSHLKCNHSPLPKNYVFSWGNGKYVKIDGIFTEVILKRGNVCHVKKPNTTKMFYLVTDGNGKWSHGDTLKEAKDDLIFEINNRTKDDYKNIKITDLLSFEEAITCYRVITGACSFGTKDFVTTRLKKKKKNYTIAEIISATKGEYGNNAFSDFFNLKNKAQ